MPDPACARCLHRRSGHDAVPDRWGYRPCGDSVFVGFNPEPAPCVCSGYVEETL